MIDNSQLLVRNEKSVEKIDYVLFGQGDESPNFDD